MSKLSELLAERNAIEQLAIEWARRWKADSAENDCPPEIAMKMVRPISFEQAEVDAHALACRIVAA